ncbi:MAG: cupin domain-containing protein, partial [Alicyclobacillus sp.]|nr:cupin domain-containing protein [Alicyclobacillus sp.]
DDYSARRYTGGMVRPISDRHAQPFSPLSRYKWALTQASLRGMAEFEPDPFDGYTVEYINPANGQDADGRIGARMTLLPAGFRGKAHRHVHSTVYCVHRGTGYTVINGVRFDWAPGDFFVIPSWAWHEHVNTGSEEAYLFSVNDLPIMEAFGFEQVRSYAEHEGHQPITGTFEPLRP